MKVDRRSLRLGHGTEKTLTQLQTEKTDQEITNRKEYKFNRSICSFQKRVGPPEYRKWRRIHGLQLPLHPQQIVGWIILLGIGIATFLVMIPALRSIFREVLFVVLGALFTLHIVSHLTALLLDPADPELRGLETNFTVPEFDRTKHAHVIENGRCHLCNIKTSGLKTKHCSVCNKCVDRFDHHCKWLNHCIGGRNYVPFLICVVSAVVASFVVVAVSVLEILYYNVKPELLTIFPVNHNETTEELFLSDSAFLSIVTGLGLLAATTSGLLLHLCLFHCYISILGISTYEYIRNYRQEGGSGAQTKLFRCNCCHESKEVMSNHIDTSQNSKNKFKNWCYYSCSRPPENVDGGEKENEHCRAPSKICFFKVQPCLNRNKIHKRKILKRQSTDPEFVDKIIKPFLITLNEEKNIEAASTTKSCFFSISERNKRDKFVWGVKDDDKGSSDPKSAIEPDEVNVGKHSRCWCFTNQNRSSTHRPESTVKIRNNQIRPESATSAAENEEVKNPEETSPRMISNQSSHIKDVRILPQLTELQKNLQGPVDLKELSDVFDLVDRSEFEFAVSTKSIYWKTRKKNYPALPRSPPLSPIRESGLSNPGSPRVDLVLPPTPVFIRPTSPETSMIFLSNPNSLSSSSDEEDDNNEVVMHPNIMVKRHYKSEDILQTPQLRRKLYPESKREQVFVLKPPKSRHTKWIDVEIKNEV